MEKRKTPEGFNKRFDKIDQTLVKHNNRFDQHDQRFDKLDQRLDQHDQRFDLIDQKLDNHESQLIDLAINVVDIKEEVKEIKENMATKDDICNLHTTMDQIVGLYKKHDQELLFMGQRLNRCENR